MGQNPEFLLLIFCIVCVVWLCISSIYVYKTYSTVVNALVLGVVDNMPYRKNNMAKNLWVVEYSYADKTYQRKVFIKSKDTEPGQIVSVNINPKNPQKVYHSSSNISFMILTAFMLFCAICIAFKLFG